AARELWDRQAGLVHDDEELYEERAAAFLEWFTLDLRGDGSAPIDRMLGAAADEAPERPALVALAASHRSVFRVRQVHADGLLLDDLWGGAAFRVRERRQLGGVEVGELF